MQMPLARLNCDKIGRPVKNGATSREKVEATREKIVATHEKRFRVPS